MTNHQPRSPRWTLALTSLAFFMIALDALVVATALPAIRHDLHAGVSTLGWTVNIYSLTYAVGIITAAALGDRLGRRRVFLGGLGLFSLASAACALAPGIGLLLAARAVQGLGAAAIMPLSLTLLTAAFPAGFQPALGAAAGLSLLSALAALGVARVTRPAPRQPWRHRPPHDRQAQARTLRRCPSCPRLSVRA